MTNKITMKDAQKLIDTDEVLLPFGKFRGQSLEDIPNYYLSYILDNNFLRGVYEYLLIPAEKELNYRKQFNIFIEG